MQCHKCEYNGKGNEICLSCNSSDYLDNDFKTITPVGDIQEVQKNIDPTYLHRKQSKSLIKFSKEKTPKNLEDCANVLKELKKCHHSSFKHIACMVALFLSVGIHAPLLVSVLEGESLSDYAKSKNVSKQAVQQLWNRLVKNNLLQDIKNRKADQHKTTKNKKRSKTRLLSRNDIRPSPLPSRGAGRNLPPDAPCGTPPRTSSLARRSTEVCQTHRLAHKMQNLTVQVPSQAAVQVGVRMYRCIQIINH